MEGESGRLLWFSLFAASCFPELSVVAPFCRGSFVSAVGRAVTMVVVGGVNENDEHD